MKCYRRYSTHYVERSLPYPPMEHMKQNFYETLKNKDCTPLIPPRKNAALWEDGHPRNEAVMALRDGIISE